MERKSPGVLSTITTRPFHCIQQPRDGREPSSEQTQPRADPKGAFKTLVWKTQGDFCTCLQYVLSADLTAMNSLRELQRFPNKGSYPFRITHEKHRSLSLWVTPGCRAKRNQTPPAQLGEGVPCLWCLWLQTAFLFLTPEKTFCRESLFLFALLLFKAPFSSFAWSAFPNRNVNTMLLCNSENLKILNEDGSIKFIILHDVDNMEPSPWSHLLGAISYCSAEGPFLMHRWHYVGCWEPPNSAQLSCTLGPFSDGSFLYLSNLRGVTWKSSHSSTNVAYGHHKK